MGKKKKPDRSQRKKKKINLKPLKSKIEKAKKLYESQNIKKLKKNLTKKQKYRQKARGATKTVETDDLFFSTLTEHEGLEGAQKIMEGLESTQDRTEWGENMNWKQEEGYEVLESYKLSEMGELIPDTKDEKQMDDDEEIQNKEETQKEKKMITERAKKDKRDMIVISSKDRKMIPKAIEKAWAPLGVPTALIHQLYRLDFTTPTPIQEKVIPQAIKRQRNIISVAKTGSGKTLAFALPMLTKIVNADASKKVCRGLVICPTRELAMQVRDHFLDVIRKLPIHVEVIIGGMSRQKQERILTTKKPQILISTPGRLYEYLCDSLSPFAHLAQMEHTLDMVVLDEVDRMVQDGHFSELDQILDRIAIGQNQIQKIVTSATLKNAKKEIEALTTKMHYTPKNSITIDLDGDILADTIVESQIRCQADQRDLHLFYLLYLFKGKSLVFANSLSAVKHIYDMMTKLGITCLQLHRNMKMRQRLNAIDRFKSPKYPNCALIATDLAARGIDIPSVNQVIHYKLPPTAELYIHRCGRSGRAGADGFSVAFITEEDHKRYKKIVLRDDTQVKPLPLFPLKQFYLRDMKKRVRIANELVSMNRHYSKKRSEASWMRKMAKEADILIDDDMMEDDEMNLQETKKRNRLEIDFAREMKKTIGTSKIESKKYALAGETKRDMNFLSSNHLSMADEFAKLYSTTHMDDDKE